MSAGIVHELWCWEVDSLDEIDDDSQLALVWCETHQKYEWHNLRRDLIGSSATIQRTKPAGWKGAI